MENTIISNPQKPKRIMKKSTKDLIVTTVKYIGLAVLSFFLLLPTMLMISRSFMSDNDVNFRVLVLPSEFTMVAYQRAFNLKMIYWIGNTLIIFALNAVGAIVSATLCAYGFAKLKFKGRNICFGIVLSTMMLPAISMQVPLYALYTNMGWLGTWFPLTVPAFFGGGAGTIFLMRQFMLGIPSDLSEAAKIDGANKFTIYLRIVVPLCLPIIAYTAVNTFIAVWNDFQNPLMYLGSYEPKFTISLGLYNTYKATANMYNYANVQSAAGVGMTIPCVILFFIFQRTIINGITVGAVKG